VAELDETFVGQDMHTYARAPAFLENPRIYGDYGLLLSDVLYGIYNLNMAPRKHLLSTVVDKFKKSPIKGVQLVKDGISAVRAL
jgi:electron transfer flavoprotein-quinone oxidoreductase